MGRVGVSSAFRYITLSVSLLLAVPGISSARPPSLDQHGFHFPFIANEGQMDPEVSFYTKIPGGKVCVTTAGGILYVMEGKPGSVLRETFTQSLGSEVTGREQADAVVNFYNGSNPSLWRESVQTWRKVSLGRKYPHIDVMLKAAAGTVEKVITVYPGGNVPDIECRIANAGTLELEPTGHLLVRHPMGEIRFTPPYAFQEIEGRRSEVRVSYRVQGEKYGFEVKDYDKTLPLIIDPLLSSTYIGGSGNETAYALEASGGDIFVAGTSDSIDFPGLEEVIGVTGDAFVVRLDPDLTTIRAATYFGGSMTEGVRRIATGGGAIYAAGYNNSPNFPTTPGAAYSGTSLSGAFIVKMDPHTLRITASTSFHANVFGLAWSNVRKEVYAAGSTGDTGIPLTSSEAPAYQYTHKGGADSFIAVLDKDLTAVKGATLLGGEGFDIIYALAVDEEGYPIAGGITNSAAFPVTENAFGPHYNLDWEASHQWIDGFVARLTPDLDDLVSATYLGGGKNDYIAALAVDGSLILVGGNTASADFPCASTFGPVDGNDAFVALLSEDLSTVKSCSIFGGSRPGTDSPESVSSVAFHPSGSVVAVGKTNAGDFPTTPGAFLPTPSGAYFGAFIISFSRDLSTVEASTLVHGGSEDLKAVALDIWGDVVVAGDSTGSGYPVTPGAIQSEHKGGDDLVLSRFTSDLTGPHIELVPRDLDFGVLATGAEESKKIVIYNTGGSELRIMDAFLISNPGEVFGLEDECRIVPAFGSCSIEIGFKPETTGSHKGELVIDSDDIFNKRIIVDLKGRSLPGNDGGQLNDTISLAGDPQPPRIEASPDPCVFDQTERNRGSERTIRVRNSGGGVIYLGEVRLEPDKVTPFRIREDTCTGAVLRGASGEAGNPDTCEVRIVYSPGKNEKDSARLLLFSLGAHEVRHFVTLIGKAADPEPGYSRFWGWAAILVLILRMVLGLPVSASGWGRWMRKKAEGKR